jgi:arginase
LDLDVVDPGIAPGVGTPVRGGLTYREAHLVMELINEAGIVTSLDVVEVNPILDDRNGTAELAVELVASLMGRQIIGLPD